MTKTLFYNATVINEGAVIFGYILTEGQLIKSVGEMDELSSPEALGKLVEEADEAIDCRGKWVIPGVIDTHVHFRDPGLTEKADMATESRAAVSGGVTSFIDMPNTRPATTSMEAVEAKMDRAAQVSVANYGFFLGATNDNIKELLDADYSKVAGVKLFLGSSTGNMLVDSESTLSQIFGKVPALIAVHAEDEEVIRAARERLKAESPDGSIAVERHPDVRPREACVMATAHAISLAENSGARLHVCHISTADELRLIADAKGRGVKVTAETCPQYLMFDRNDFLTLGARVKCNPAIKEPSDRIALLRELHRGVIDTIATDHAPHLLSQKEGDALTAASGMPMIQFSLAAMLDLMRNDPSCDDLTPADVVELMCHAPARIFGIERRGFIRPGYYADLVVLGAPGARLADPETPWTPPRRITDDDAIGRCGWTPLAGRALADAPLLTMVSGSVAYRDGKFMESSPMPLRFTNHVQP